MNADLYSLQEKMKTEDDSKPKQKMEESTRRVRSFGGCIELMERFRDALRRN